MPIRLLLFVSLLFTFALPARAEQIVAELMLRVQVQGAVKHPGVYRMPSGARIAEAIAKAGGPRKDAHLRALNLAERLVDGEKVYVPTQKEAAPPAPVAAPPQARAPRAYHAAVTVRPHLGPLNLNTATQAQLEGLPGVGPGLAAAILRQRARKGRFGSVEDLREVSGIGKKRFERLRQHVAVY